MKLKDYPKEELELMGYDDIALIILKEKGSKMKPIEIFKKICTILELSEKDYENKIGDFLELLLTNKKFIMLKNGYCDLKNKYNAKMIVDEDEEEVVETPAPEFETETETKEDIFCDDDDDDDEEQDDDLNDLVIINLDEEQTEEE